MLIKISIIFCSLLALLFMGCSGASMNTQNSGFQQKYGEYNYCDINAVRQMEANSCGTACLTSILNYWKVDVTEQDILTEFPKSKKEGYLITELRDIAATKGLGAYVFSMTENSMFQLKKEILKGRPVLCAMRFPEMLYFAYDVPIYGYVYRRLAWTIGPKKDHYVVVFGFDRDNFLVMDPVRGFVSISEKDFEVSWKGKDYAVLLCAREGGS